MWPFKQKIEQFRTRNEKDREKAVRAVRKVRDQDLLIRIMTDGRTEMPVALAALEQIRTDHGRCEAAFKMWISEYVEAKDIYTNIKEFTAKKSGLFEKALSPVNDPAELQKLLKRMYEIVDNKQFINMVEKYGYGPKAQIYAQQSSWLYREKIRPLTMK